MISNFGNKLTKDLVEENISKEYRSYPSELIKITRRKLQMIHEAHAVNDLKVPPGNRLEKLKGNYLDHFSIRINEQWRIVFRFEGQNALDVKVIDYH